jgi:hypothetical protein
VIGPEADSVTVEALLPLLLAAGCALIGLVLAMMLASGKISLRIGGPALILVAVGVEASSVATAAVAAWDKSGAVLPGPILMVSGGVAFLVAVLVGWLTRD